jgi:hypothetical protein
MKIKLEKIEELVVNLKSYTNSSIELVKLEIVNHISHIIANLINRLVIGLVFILFAIFLSLGICFYLSELFGNTYLGFGVVASVYLLVGIIFIIGRKKLLFKPIRNKIIQEIFQNQTNTE